MSQRPSVVRNRVVGEFGEFVGAVGGGVVDEEGDLRLGVAVPVDVQVEHELAEGAFEAGRGRPGGW